jgi:hypothetical protein
MRYEEEMQSIPTGPVLGPYLLESHMRSFLGTILAPCFAIAALGLVAFVPTPSEIALAFKPYGAELVTVAGDDNAGNSQETVAERVKIALGPAIGDNADCFEDLKLANAAKLDRCGRLVYQALAEVNENPNVFQTDVAQSADPKALVQELKLAATEVCRERWSREGSIPRNSPACEIALASAVDQARD